MGKSGFSRLRGGDELLMVLSDARKLGHRRKSFRGAPLWKRKAGHRSVRSAVTGSTPTTAKRVNCFRCTRAGHKRHDCWKQIWSCAWDASRQGCTAAGAARSTGRIGDTSSSFMKGGVSLQLRKTSQRDSQKEASRFHNSVSRALDQTILDSSRSG